MTDRVGNATKRVAYPAQSLEGDHCDPEQGCITCGDVAVELEVMQVDADRGLALVRDEQDRRETVETALVEPVAIGDLLLVHAGTAISHLGREDAPMGTPRMPGREAEDMRQVSEFHPNPPAPASPQGAGRGDAVGSGFQ